MLNQLQIVFDGELPNATFVEVETLDGNSVSAGEWVSRADGLAGLNLPVARIQPLSDFADKDGTVLGWVCAGPNHPNYNEGERGQWLPLYLQRTDQPYLAVCGSDDWKEKPGFRKGVWKVSHFITLDFPAPEQSND